MAPDKSTRVDILPRLLNCKRFLTIVKHLEVTNDCAERGIKLFGDFRECAQNKDQRQLLLQLVEHRKQNPSYMKSKLINTL